MVVCAAGYQCKALCQKFFCQSLCICHNLLCISLELRLQAFTKSHSLSCDDVHQWTALDSRENSLVELVFICKLLAREDHSAPWSTESLVGCSCGYMCIWDGAWMETSCYKTCDVSHVHHKDRSYRVCNLTESLEVNHTRICGGTCDDKLWLAFRGNPCNFVIVDESVLFYTIRNDVEVGT